MLKFRTMAVDADDRRTGLLATGAGSQLLFKMRQDPRVTPLGRLLRRASLDELPQLVNVVRGDMALVGPRPALPSETALYDVEARRRLVVRPGLTGLWQVSGRSDLTWEESIRLDLRYVEGWSLGLDAWILLRTVGAVARPAWRVLTATSLRLGMRQGAHRLDRGSTGLEARPRTARQPPCFGAVPHVVTAPGAPVQGPGPAFPLSPTAAIGRHRCGWQVPGRSRRAARLSGVRCELRSDRCRADTTPRGEGDACT